MDPPLVKVGAPAVGPGGGAFPVAGAPVFGHFSAEQKNKRGN